MKKIPTILLAAGAPVLVHAQTQPSTYIDKDIFNVCATIVVIALLMGFVLMLVKRMMDHRLKNKVIEKGIPATLSDRLLQSHVPEEKIQAIKWFVLLTGLGAALTIIYYTPPLGIHSLAIIAFCLAASFLGYYLFLKKSGH